MFSWMLISNQVYHNRSLKTACWSLVINLTFLDLYVGIRVIQYQSLYHVYPRVWFTHKLQTTLHGNTYVSMLFFCSSKAHSCLCTFEINLNATALYRASIFHRYSKLQINIEQEKSTPFIMFWMSFRQPSVCLFLKMKIFMLL